MLLEALRQENIHPANAGELAIVEGFFDYIDQVAVPLMMEDEWVFGAVEQFAKEYATDCFDSWERTGTQATKARIEKEALDERVIDFVARAAVHYRAIDVPTSGDKLFLHKASDFYEKLRLRNLPAKERGRAKKLHRDVSGVERRYLKTILENIREDYEVVLPRIMLTMRRVIRVEKGLDPSNKSSYNRLLGISDSLTWYEEHIKKDHALYPVTGWLADFYKVARNVASHVEGIHWDPATNLVALPDDSVTIEVKDNVFIQRYRFFVTICEMGMSAILAAYSEKCKDELSVELARNYIEMIRRIDSNHPTYGDGSITVCAY